MSNILVIDDDESLRDTIGIMLEQEGFCPLLVADGKTGFERALAVKPDLMIVDLRLPGMSGIEICKQVRAANLKTPIIVLSAVGEEVDKVLLLEIGADDYIVKPFGARELLARIRAVLRRTSPEARKVAQFGRVAVDFERRIVSKRGEPLKMTPAEYNLLTLFPAESGPAFDARHDSQFRVGLRIVSQYAHGGCARGAVAAKAGDGRQLAAPLPYGAWRWIPVRAVSARRTARLRIWSFPTMTPDLVRYFVTAGLAFFVLTTQADLALAQDTPEMREVLSRLERLEESNQALTEEIRALRKELATLYAPEPAPPAQLAAQASPDPQSPPSSQPLAEVQAVEQSRIAELAQTKVEASQKFPIRITGMALFNAYTNGRYNNESDNPTIASLSRGEATGGGTLRQSTLGLLFDGPATFLGGKVSGSLYMDFFGGSTSSLNHMVRLRTAAINLDWANTTVTVGQDKPIISPRDPDSLARKSAFRRSPAPGNLWLWQPQIRLEQRLTSAAKRVAHKPP